MFDLNLNIILKYKRYILLNIFFMISIGILFAETYDIS